MSGIEEAIRFITSGLILAALAALVQETHLLYTIWLSDTTIVAIRERVIASICRLGAATIFSILIFNRLYRLDIVDTATSNVFAAIGVLVLSVPPVRFLHLYSHHGFRPPTDHNSL